MATPAVGPRSTDVRDEPGRALRITLAVFAVVAVLAAAAVVAQPLLAGHLMTGNGGARQLHQAIGTEILGPLLLTQAVVALLAVRRRPGTVLPLVLSITLLGVLFVQATWGFGGRMALHVPVGIAMVVGQVYLATTAVRRVRRPAPLGATGGPR